MLGEFETALALPKDDPIRWPKRTTGTEVDDLAERLRERDPGAMELLYDRLGRRAFGLAFRILGDGAAAEDAVQDAFLALWSQSNRIDPARGRVDSLLLTIVHRRAIDVLRAARGRDAGTSVFEMDTADPEAETAIEAVFDVVTHKQIVDALTQLPDDQRVAIELAYFEGLTQAEVASKVGVPLGTVKSRLRVGLERLRGVPASRCRMTLRTRRSVAPFSW